MASRDSSADTDAACAGLLKRCRAHLKTDVKEALRENTALAREVGACGVPTLQLIYDHEDEVAPRLLWGQDRLHMLQIILVFYLNDEKMIILLIDVLVLQLNV